MKAYILFLELRGGASVSMAAQFAKRLSRSDINILCATVERSERDSLADTVMADLAEPRDPEQVVPMDALPKQEIDIVVVLSRASEFQLPLLPGRPAVIHWNLPDPSVFSSEPERRREQYLALRDTLREQVADLFSQGYVDSLMAMRANSDLILDAISDGILVHDTHRRIVLFNHAAEVITGRNRDDVVGRDCHDVFGCGFCHGKCALENATEKPPFDERRARLDINTTEGERRTLDACVRPLMDSHNRWVGLVVVFHDVTREIHLARQMGEMQSFAGMVGRDAKMLAVFDLVRDVADTNVPILIQGESGTGKELVAAAIHNESSRAGRPFIAVNCGALPEGLLESELFGHVKGAFTGAIRDKKGRFELADGGTIFLDEIGDVPPAMQVRLLRVLQEGVMQRVGSETPIRVDVRVISATHRDLQKEIATGRFREDLFYRLNVVPIWMPPLRERLADLPLLVDHLLARFLSEMGRTGSVRVSPDAMDLMLSHTWPGNVRELQNWLQYALVKCRGDEIRPEHLPSLRTTVRPSDVSAPTPSMPAVRMPLTSERVREALIQTHGNRRDAARFLGVGRATLYRFFDSHPDALPGSPDALPS